MVFQPLVVDLDGTLINTDMLYESALVSVREKPWETLCIPFWLMKGKAALKQRLARQAAFDPEALPYNTDLLAWLRQEHAQGRKLVLCTAADHAVAKLIADHLKIFDDVMASDGQTNLAGPQKADALEQRFGRGGFDYAGNSRADLAVWQRARSAIIVNGSLDLAKKAQTLCKIEQIFPSNCPDLAVWARLLRVHQWLKNLLLFIPIFAAHQLANGEYWAALIPAFISFCLCASSVYLANDLLDLESDRLHPRKRHRPLASGRVPTWAGAALAPVLLTAAMGLGAYVGSDFLFWLTVYFLVTCIYSWGLKRLMLIDCLTLAMLYTLRIIAGAAAVGMSLSFWLLAFSVFLFLSLAYIKRYAELEVQLLGGGKKAHGRGYYTADAQLIQTLGIASGFGSVLVLALYINSEAVMQLYQAPEFVWGTVPILLFWISWMWMKAHRGEMHDDPLVFAVKDRASWLAGAAFALVLMLGKAGWPW